MDGWCLVRSCFEKMVVADVLGCSCQKRGRMKKSWLVHVSLFFEGKNQANVGRGSILPALPVGPTGPWMYQGWSSGAMHSCYRSLVLKTKGNCFSWDFVTIFWRSYCTLMCWCVLINWKGTIYDCECFVTEWRCPESYMFLANVWREGKCGFGLPALLGN